MEENTKITLEDAMRMVIDNLGNISIPNGILAIADPNQLMAIKNMVINPVEQARLTLMEILRAYEDGIREAKKAEQEREAREVLKDATETDAE